MPAHSFTRLATVSIAAILAAGLAAPAAAEIELSFYGGWQTSPHSRATGTYGSGTNIDPDFNALIGWDGKSFSMPPYYGMRATWWRDDSWGLGLEFSHDKAYAPEGEMTAAGFERLEFTDGHNIITANVSRRWVDGWGAMTPYVSAGLGFAMPHVDVTPTGGDHTFGYQVTGPAARLTAGVNYPLSERWSVFGEYQFTWSDNTAELEGGGELNTRLITNALNVGVGFKF
ncbi:lipid A oxidase [Pseudooceanicola antarcticus]|uniref:Lipid A oxidase n=1 Tax=Pseudooceanicola antarcticus TaxID=1247613 RepID=A0A285HWV3_9RHOB|nr:outer membrane beta-barrel protein [Pseudooceanicola antarcticus]PJE27376.1 lipid A oxidase [Pseudooceanicola antarcticus]SNY40174.1 lipid A oxidase [Pseudooceanicola antarcticus]